AGIFIDREDLSSDISSNERPLAKAVASAARAINLGGDTEKEHIRTKFEKTGFYRMRKTLRKRQDDPTKDDFPAYHVLHKLLSKSYNPDSKTQK
ncbi:MAG TPA: hypothetical protein VK141_04115, partial [Nitrosomonas sp.]|nr:hypothetical protein [Nitrosomonas sp.]